MTPRPLRFTRVIQDCCICFQISWLKAKLSALFTMSVLLSSAFQHFLPWYLVRRIFKKLVSLVNHHSRPARKVLLQMHLFSNNTTKNTKTLACYLNESLVSNGTKKKQNYEKLNEVS